MDTGTLYTQLDNLMPLFREQFAAGKSVTVSPRGINWLRRRLL